METLCTDGKDNEGGMWVRVNSLQVRTPSEGEAGLSRARLFCCTVRR